MMKKRKPKHLVEKVEIDEKTNEPYIVTQELDDCLEENFNTETIKSVALEDSKSAEEIGRQIVMSKVFGFIKEEENINKRQRFFKNLFTAIFIVLVVAVLVFTFYNDFFSPNADRTPITWENISKTISLNWYYIIFALVSLGFCFLFKGLKLSVMSKFMTKKWHFRTCFETGIIGHYYNSVTPLAVGGQPFEIYHLSKHGIHGGIAASLPISTYFLNQFAFVIMVIVAIAFLPFNRWENLTNNLPPTISILAIIGLVLCFAMPSLVIIFSIFPRLASTLVKFVMWIGVKLKIIKDPKKTTFTTLKTVILNSRCLKKVAKNPLVFSSSFLMSVGEQLAMSSIAYFTLKFFGFNLHLPNGFIEWLTLVQLCLILYSAISFIPTPGNSGAADLSFYLLFSYGLSAGLAFPAMVVWRFLSFYMFIILGFIFTKIEKGRQKNSNL